MPIHTKDLIHLLFASWLSGSEHLCLPAVPCYNVLSHHRPRNNRVKFPWAKTMNGTSLSLSPLKSVFFGILPLRKSLTLTYPGSLGWNLAELGTKGGLLSSDSSLYTSKSRPCASERILTLVIKVKCLDFTGIKKPNNLILLLFP